VNTAFVTNMAVDVRDAGGFLVQNVSVTFTAPGSGASGTFPGGVSVTVVTNASGRATAPTFTANTIAGGYLVTAQAAGGGNPSTTFSLTNNPEAPDHFAVTTTAANPDVAGTPFDVTVTVQDMFNNTVTAYTGTITFSTMDPSGGSFTPPTYTFVPGDNGMRTFPGGATLFRTGTWDVTATDGSGVTGFANVTVIAAPAMSFAIAVPDSVGSGMPFSITVSAVDPYTNIDTNYVTDPSGVVTFFSTTEMDPGLMLPADTQFTADDAGMKTFDNVVYITPGAQDLNATDTVSGITGTATVNVTGGDAPGRGGGLRHGGRNYAGIALGEVRSGESTRAPVPRVEPMRISAGVEGTEAENAKRSFEEGRSQTGVWERGNPPTQRAGNGHMLAESLQALAAGDPLSAERIDWVLGNWGGNFTRAGVE
jgi:hypothetical protein